MALGKIKADTLEHSTAGSITTNTLVLSSVKAFVQQDSGTSLNESFNVSSLTDNSTGRYEVALTNAFSNANYSLNVSGGATSGNCSVDDSHYEAGVMCTRFYRTDTSAYMDSDHVSMYGVGDLA